jgi:hypothetical protein
MAYDAKNNTYPYWRFNNKGVLGEEWTYVWDEVAKALVGTANDLPAGSTSHGEFRFAANSCAQFQWLKDAAGTKVIDRTAQKARQLDAAGDSSAWSKIDNAGAPAEVKVLEPLVGVWDAPAVSKVTEWSPQEQQTTNKVTREWVLDGHVLLETSEVSDGRSTLALLAFDSRTKKYIQWWFSSEGATAKSIGDWHAASATLALKTGPENGLTSHTAIRVHDKDRHVAQVVVADQSGKRYHDKMWTAARRPQ